uniref:Uncharacterized protein n=1 Tax=Arundo donax TaxID=35708 RepID=A0A0A9E832_ARUDO
MQMVLSQFTISWIISRVNLGIARSERGCSSRRRSQWSWKSHFQKWRGRSWTVPCCTSYPRMRSPSGSG